MTEWTKNARVTDWVELACRVGMGNVNMSEMARKHGVSINTAQKDKAKAYTHLASNKGVVEKSKGDMQSMYEQVVNELQAELVRAKGSQKAAIASQLLAWEEKRTTFFERWGLKESQGTPDTNVQVVFSSSVLEKVTKRIQDEKLIAGNSEQSVRGK